MREQGQMLVLVIVVSALVLVNTLVIVGGSQLFFQNSTYTTQSTEATQLAEAGIDKALASLNTAGSVYTGESETPLGNGSFSVVVSSPTSDSKIITAVGYIPSKEKAKVKRTISINAAKGEGISFNYAVQVGEGGLAMSNGSKVNGSVYSNGNIVMGNNTQITGDVFIAGGTAPEADQQSVCAGISCADFIFDKLSNGPIDVAQSFRPSISGYFNKVAMNLKKTGNPYDLTVRILSDSGGSPNKDQILATGTLTSNLVTSAYSFAEVSFTSSPNLIAGTTYWLVVDGYDNASDYYYWSADSSQGYTSGSAKWSPNWQAVHPVWNATSPSVDLDFKTYMGGVITSIIGSSGASIGGEAHANTLQQLSVTKGAYYQSQQSIIVGGSSCINNSKCHPGSADPPPVSMPISDANISAWKQEAEGANIYPGDRMICGGVLSSGKYTANISSYNNCTVLVRPPIWITGDLSLANNVTYKIDPSLGNASGVIIVDGRIALSNNTRILGSGSTGSYLIPISLYDSRTNGVSAIEVSNSGNTGVLYAPIGIISIGNSNRLTGLTAWKISLNNSVELEYDTKLATLFFSSDPTGAYSVMKGTYQQK